MKDDKNQILLYSDENGKTNVFVRFADENVWVTAVQLAEIYNTTRQNIGQHIENIYNDNELPREATVKKFFIVQQEGKRQVRRELDHYNLDVIIAIGYRVQSEVAVRFRRWATLRLHEYIQKGFTMQKAEKEYEIFRANELANLKSDFDLFLENIKEIKKLPAN